MKRYHNLDDDASVELFLYSLKTLNLSSYRYIFQLNKKFGFGFERIQDLSIYQNGEEFQFVQYYYFDPNSLSKLYLIQNTSLPSHTITAENELFEQSTTQELLLKKRRDFNFILKSNQPLTEEILLHLSSDSNLISLQEIDIEEVRRIIKYIA